MKSIELYKQIQSELPGVADHAIAGLVLSQVIIDFTTFLDEEPLMISGVNDVADAVDSGTTEIVNAIKYCQ